MLQPELHDLGQFGPRGRLPAKLVEGRPVAGHVVFLREEREQQHPRVVLVHRREVPICGGPASEQAEAYLGLLRSGASAYRDLSAVDQHYARMLLFSLFPQKDDMASYGTAFDQLRREPAARAELAQIVELGLEHARHRTIALPVGLTDTALRVHARYSREEIVAALGYATLERAPSSMMQGVFHAKDLNTDVFLVTLKKSEADYSPTTLYRDYAISPDLFHWESQSQTTVPVSYTHLRA